MGDWLIVWSARLFVALYFCRLAIDLLVADPAKRERRSRFVWTAGCAVFVFHLGCAFHFLHHWSHAAAVEHSARRTYEVIGVNWGGGIYFNHAFLLLWVADVAWWWLRAAREQATPPAVYWTVQAVFAFMMFNATVVFGPPFWKWIVPAALTALAVARILQRRASDLPSNAEPVVNEISRSL